MWRFYPCVGLVGFDQIGVLHFSLANDAPVEITRSSVNTPPRWTVQDAAVSGADDCIDNDPGVAERNDLKGCQQARDSERHVCRVIAVLDRCVAYAFEH